MPHACVQTKVMYSLWMKAAFRLLSFAATVVSYKAYKIAYDEVNLPKVKPEFLMQNSLRHDEKNKEQLENELSYVFLQRFPLEGTPFFHTEVLVCPQSQFSSSDQSSLNDYVASISAMPKLGTTGEKHIPFVEIDESWWTQRTSSCVELGYGSAPCKRKCCGVPHGQEQQTYSLNARQSMITNADTSQKALFLYGVGHLSGNDAYEDLCDTSHEKCWSNWSGLDYKLLKNNCNTFTSTVLSCVYGLSEEKPDLGVSDLVTVNCQCDLYESENFESISLS